VEEFMAEKDKAQAEAGDFSTHAQAAARAFVLAGKSLLPDKFWEYSAEAGREALLAVSAVMDSVADRLDEDETPGSDTPKGRPPRKARVNVE
jgi:hypothetical protein